jgi:hypothetical protein
MKKIVLILLICGLAVCAYFCANRTKFKNPVFYQTLTPFSGRYGYIYVTPTSVEFKRHKEKSDFDYKGQCDLVENEEDRMTLKCNGKWNEESEKSSYFTFTVKDLILSDCLKIAVYEYNSMQDLQSNNPFYTSSYCAIPPQSVSTKIKNFFADWLGRLKDSVGLSDDKTKFKNPVFNQPLEPFSNQRGYVYLTPTSIDIREIEDKNTSHYKGECDLIKNEQDRIDLDCHGKRLDWMQRLYEDRIYVTYVIKDVFLSRCLEILEYEYEFSSDAPKQIISVTHYCVPLPPDMASESD